MSGLFMLKALLLAVLKPWEPIVELLELSRSYLKSLAELFTGYCKIGSYKGADYATGRCCGSIPSYTGAVLVIQLTRPRKILPS